MPGTCTPNDLNFYCPKHNAAAVVSYFTRLQGFTNLSLPTRKVVVERTPLNNLDVNNGVRRIYRFRCMSTGKTITLVESVSVSPLVPIFFFHSTVVMNVVTGRSVVCFYPDLTETYRGRCVTPNFALPAHFPFLFPFFPYRIIERLPSIRHHSQARTGD
ncbi:hypothetical protein DFP72DRAFT_829139 [Ephemerocybe angulata]|uniref:Uncharacterized protein n=1 Tax=Ephemerocybe angulata TaxID=980116 RepID=A0A8H6HBC2_9AGAR|nr:hypothetical protein DFP72DRAFT_829139 [Tulosesus angulatus]